MWLGEGSWEEELTRDYPGASEMRDQYTEKRKRQYDLRGGGWNDAAPSEGVPGATRR